MLYIYIYIHVNKIFIEVIIILYPCNLASGQTEYY